MGVKYSDTVSWSVNPQKIPISLNEFAEVVLADGTIQCERAGFFGWSLLKDCNYNVLIWRKKSKDTWLSNVSLKFPSTLERRPETIVEIVTAKAHHYVGRANVFHWAANDQNRILAWRIVEPMPTKLAHDDIMDSARFLDHSGSMTSVVSDPTINTTQPKPYSMNPEAKNPIVITHRTLVNGTDIRDINENDLFAMIAAQEAKIKELEAIQNKPTSLTKQIEARKAGIAALVEYLNNEAEA